MVENERRAHLRYYEPESLLATARFPTKADLPLRVKEIGLGGLCFTTDTDVSGESFFELSLEIAREDEAPLQIDTSAEIIWHLCDETISEHTAGVKFIGLKERDRESLRIFLSKLRPKPGP